MSKTVIILGTSRNDGNTRKMVDELRSKGGYDLINLSDFNIGYFEYEFKNKDDDFIPLMERIVKEYETLLFATPVYWYSMSAQMKTFIDRFSDLVRDRKDIGRQLRGKKMAALNCSHSSDQPESYFMPFKESANYLGMTYLGDARAWSSDGTVSDEVKSNILELSRLL